MIKEAKFFLARIDRSWEEKFSVAQTGGATAHCSTIKLWANALSSSPLCFKYPFFHKPIVKPKKWSSFRVMYGTEKSSNKFDEKGGGCYILSVTLSVCSTKNSQQSPSRRLTRPNKSISSCNNCPTLGTLLSSPCPLHQIMLTLATSTRRDKYLLKWTSNRNWIKHSFRQVIKSPFLLLIITDP